LGFAASHGDGMQIKISTVIYSLLVLLAFAPFRSAVAADDSATRQGVLIYSLQSSPAENSITLKLLGGKPYHLALSRELDAQNHVVVLDAVLEKGNKTHAERNLLNTSPKSHGYQPHLFAALDFANGIEKSAYGNLRVISLPELGISVELKVLEVKVTGISTNPSSGAGYAFTNLTIEVRTRTLSEDMAHNHTQ